MRGLPAFGFRLSASGCRLPASRPLFILRCAQDEEWAGREKRVHQAPSTVRRGNRARKNGVILKSVIIDRGHSDGRFLDFLSLAPCKGGFILALAIARNGRKA